MLQRFGAINPVEWVFVFYLYCFFGWCFESTYVSIHEKKLVNRGFIHGPFLPIYGLGGIMMRVIARLFPVESLTDLLVLYVVGCIGPTILEYITAALMENLFKVRYWTYEGKFLNIKGRICLESTLTWGVLTVVVVEVLGHFFEGALSMIPLQVMIPVTNVVTLWFLIDFGVSFKQALDLRDFLVKMEKMKEELVRMQKRLDVLIAAANESRQNMQKAYEMRMDDLMASLESSLNSMKQAIAEKPGEYLDSVKEEVTTLKTQLAAIRQKEWEWFHVPHFSVTSILKRNPTIVAFEHKVSLEDMKDYVFDRAKRLGETVASTLGAVAAAPGAVIEKLVGNAGESAEQSADTNTGKESVSSDSLQDEKTAENTGVK
ncbi:MAG: putative ABC transporter permease [Lachnospiraceae bacterium]|nr:putative ABC transporter permease [Lachnospiraceae bacterium]